MNITIVLTQILGIVFTIFGLSIFTNKKGIMALMEEITKNQSFLWLVGFIVLIMGAVMVALNTVWNSGLLRLLVTIIGWLTLIKGIFILILPDVATSLYKKFNKESIFTVCGFVILILGLILTYRGFI
jgi:hypothetical protein